ncbi:hypothetical protein [Luteibacter yeojuensis]|nr:hypothetical protein [Luteibacter yeojuensis]
MTSHHDPAAPMDLHAFRRRVLASVDPARPETLQTVAGDIVALARHPGLLTDALRADLLREDGPLRMQTRQTCILDAFGPFVVRINLWPVEAATHEDNENLSFFAYHDHGFSFLTTHYYGPGYHTRTYTYDATGVRGEIGERVALAYAGEATLAPGTVLMYLAGRDVHAQFPPPAPSASLNLLLRGDTTGELGDQYYFDIDTGTICGKPTNDLMRRRMALALAGTLGDVESEGHLRRIADGHACPRTRDEARRVVSRLYGG